MNLLEEFEVQQTPIALYGAGKYGKIALDNIKRRYPYMNVEYFIDDDLDRNNKDVEGIQVLTLDQMLKDKYMWGGG